MVRMAKTLEQTELLLLLLLSRRPFRLLDSTRDIVSPLKHNYLLPLILATPFVFKASTLVPWYA